MPLFSNGKVTSSVIFYNRGVPPGQQNFALIAGMNYSMIKQISRFNKQNKK
jgi:hypothetical protein